ncbi:MAG: AAA family ATPase [Xenococcaceae cyanobacterium]
MSPNPFIIGQPVPPEHFVGRQTEIATAFDQILNRSHLGVWGGPGIGKSSFLEQLASRVVWEKQGQDPSKAVIVLLNCLSIYPFSASGFWHEVLSILKNKLESRFGLQAETETLLEPGKATKDSLRQVLGMLGRQGKFLLLLVDDYHAALVPNSQYTKADMEAFLAECRSLAYHSEERQYFSMIVTSSRPLHELGPKLKEGSSPWYNHYVYQPLKPFTDTEVDKLLGQTMTPALQNAVREITGSNPTLLQIASYLLYREREQRTGQIPDAQAFAREFEARTRQFFQATWELSNEIEQTLLMLIALSGLGGRLHEKHYDLSDINIIFSQKERELTSLEERGVIIRTVQERKTIYSFTSSIMERWVIQELGTSDRASLQKRQKVFLNLMSHKQAERVLGAIQWLWQHKDEVPSTLEWIGQVVKALPKGLILG